MKLLLFQHVVMSHLESEMYINTVCMQEEIIGTHYILNAVWFLDSLIGYISVVVFNVRIVRMYLEQLENAVKNYSIREIENASI